MCMATRVTRRFSVCTKVFREIWCKDEVKGATIIVPKRIKAKGRAVVFTRLVTFPLSLKMGSVFYCPKRWTYLPSCPKHFLSLFQNLQFISIPSTQMPFFPVSQLLFTHFSSHLPTTFFSISHTAYPKSFSSKIITQFGLECPALIAVLPWRWTFFYCSKRRALPSR